MKIALCFSGGAARGAYQMGVWRALRALHLDEQISAVTGTSIGAINGALFAQRDWDMAIALWEQAQPHHLFPSVQPQQASSYYKPLLRDLLLRGRVNIDGLRQILFTHLDEAAIRQSPVHFGLSVYNKTLRQGSDLFVEDIEPGLLIDYVYSSAMLPVFPPHRIGEHDYVDGGFHCIMPLGPLMERSQPDLIIAVDVSKFGKYSAQQKVWLQQYADRILYIRPSKLISPINVSPEVLHEQMALGYEEGMRVLEGSLATTALSF